MTGVAILSLGLAPLFTLAADLAIARAPPERAGAASGISETSSELGGALGLAILGALGTAVYRARTADTLPAGLPHDAAARASNTLGDAVAVADRLPETMAAGVWRPPARPSLRRSRSRRWSAACSWSARRCWWRGW